MPDPTNLARHVGYTSAGIPIVRRLNSAQCLDALPEFTGARHVGYTTSADPIAAWAWECCDVFCTDAEESGGTCHVETGCYTGGAVPGIARRVKVFLTDVDTCATARGKWAVLEYDGGLGYWVGSVELRGGTLNLIFQCNAGANDSPTKFDLLGSGCQTFALTAGYQCADPLAIDFGQALLDDCCDCQLEGTANPLARTADTDVSAEVNFYLVGNCRKTVFARHVGYDDSGTPTVARANPCVWAEGEDTEACADMVCGVYFDITDVAGCACLEVTEDSLFYRTTQWVNDGAAWSCPGGVTTISVSCAAAPTPGQLRITADITCGVTAGGSGFADIDAADLEDLDVTIGVGIDNSSDPSECCSGSVNVRVYRPAPPP